MRFFFRPWKVVAILAIILSIVVGYASGSMQSGFAHFFGADLALFFAGRIISALLIYGLPILIVIYPIRLLIARSKAKAQ